MKIVGIVAVAKNGVIGNEGDLPWRCKTDLKFFRHVTEGHIVLMGRKTFDSLPGGPLKKRVNVVVSKEHEPVDPPHYVDVQMGDYYVFNDLERAINWSTGYSRYIEADQFYVIGGATIYEQANRYITDWLITHIPLEIEGDTTFPIDLHQKTPYHTGKLHAPYNDPLKSVNTNKDYVGFIPFVYYFNGSPDKLVLLDKAGASDSDVVLTLESNLYTVRISNSKIQEHVNNIQSYYLTPLPSNALSGQLTGEAVDRDFLNVWSCGVERG
jgi:dihydrofolate reductase